VGTVFQPGHEETLVGISMAASRSSDERAWLAIALFDTTVLVITALVNLDWFIVALGVVFVGHMLDVAFLLTR
jgi:hypothetical protein